MGFDYFVFYTEASIVCILILVMLLINDKIYGSNQERQVWFNRAVVSFILYFISDACWAAVLSDQLPKTRILVALFNLTNYALMSYTAFIWLMFMAASEQMAFRNDSRKRFLCALPMIISILAIIIAYVADPYYWISPEGDLASMYYPMMISIPVLYLIASLVLSVINARKVDSRDEKKNCWLIGIFPLGVLVSGLIQVLSLKAPTYCFGCTIMLLFFYIQNMQTQISLDGLTRLNNRGQINRYMEQMNDREVYSEFTRGISVDYDKVFIMMIDVDQFKQINDTYGHSEGDRALIMVADTLRLVGENMKALVFLGRYGGDEFTVIIHNAEEEEYPKQIAETISRTLSEKAQTAQLPYELKVSIGYAEQFRHESMQECLVRADEMLYQVKRANKTGR